LKGWKAHKGRRKIRVLAKGGGVRKFQRETHGGDGEYGSARKNGTNS